MHARALLAPAGCRCLRRAPKNEVTPPNRTAAALPPPPNGLPLLVAQMLQLPQWREVRRLASVGAARVERVLHWLLRARSGEAAHAGLARAYSELLLPFPASLMAVVDALAQPARLMSGRASVRARQQQQPQPQRPSVRDDDFSGLLLSKGALMLPMTDGEDISVTCTHVQLAGGSSFQATTLRLNSGTIMVDGSSVINFAAAAVLNASRTVTLQGTVAESNTVTQLATLQVLAAEWLLVDVSASVTAHRVLLAAGGSAELRGSLAASGAVCATYTPSLADACDGDVHVRAWRQPPHTNFTVVRAPRRCPPARRAAPLCAHVRSRAARTSRTARARADGVRAAGGGAGLLSHHRLPVRPLRRAPAGRGPPLRQRPGLP